MQNSQPTKQRNTALDGLRGFSALMVVLAHLNLDQATVNRFAPWAWYLIQPFVSGGTFYVAILFVLTGYLMSTHYPKVVSWADFMQKRYTRLFPVFICVSVFYTYFYYSVIKGDPTANRNTALVVATLLGMTLVGGLIWRLYLKFRTIGTGKLLFKVFIIFQVTIAAVYALIVMRNPAASINSNQTILQIFTGLVNTTLTPTFGTYIPLTNGSFWSLAPEILYYALYPILIIPLMGRLRNATKSKLLFSSIAIWCILITLTVVFKQLLGFNGLYPFFWFYFYLGNLVSQYNDHIKLICDKHEKTFGIDKWIPILTALAFLVFPILNSTYLKSRDNILGFILFYPFPLLALIYCLRQGNIFYSFFQSRVLVWIGTVSYSLYLTHTIVIELLRGGEQIPASWQSIQVAGYVISAILLSLGLAKLLYELLEKPYFESRRKSIVPLVTHHVADFARTAMHEKFGVALLIVYVLLIGAGLQKEYSLTSVTHRETGTRFMTPVTDKSVSFADSKEFVFEIKATEDNFGIFSLPIQYVGNKTKPVGDAIDTSHTLRVTVKDIASQTTISTNEYAGWRFGVVPRPYPFGFPQQKDSKGRAYLVRFESLRSSPNDYTVVSNPQTELLTVYQIDKSKLLRNPITLLIILWRKLTLIITSSEFVWVIIINVLPLYFLLKYLSTRHESNNI